MLIFGTETFKADSTGIRTKGDPTPGLGLGTKGDPAPGLHPGFEPMT